MDNEIAPSELNDNIQYYQESDIRPQDPRTQDEIDSDECYRITAIVIRSLVVIFITIMIFSCATVIALEFIL